MTSTDAKLMVSRYVNLLAGSCAEDFAEYVSDDERYAELIHELAAEFMDERLPIIDEDAKFDVACALIDRVALQKTVF